MELEGKMDIRPPPKNTVITLLFLFISTFIVNANAAIKQTNPSLDELLAMSIEDLFNVKISVASRFNESSLQVGSTSTVITEEQWSSLGARWLSDALGNLPSTIILPNWFGAEPIYIRGYADGNNTGGIATLIDGVLINTFDGSPQFSRNNINLGILDRAEMIRGPGSALYGENAFHGVLSLHTFESEKDFARFRTDYSSNQFYDASLKYSKTIGSKWRLHTAGAVSGQGNQDQKYNYFDTTANTTAESNRELRFNTQSAIIKLKSSPINKTSYSVSYFFDKNNKNDFYSAGTSGGLASNDTGGVDTTFWMTQLGGKYQLDKNKDASLNVFIFKQERTFDRAFQPGDTTNFVGIGELVGIGEEINYGANLTLRQKKLFENTQWSLDFAVKRQDLGDYSVRQTDGAGSEFRAFPLAFSNSTRDVFSVALDSSTKIYQNKFILRYGFRFDNYSDFGSHVSPRLGLIFQPTSDSALKLLYGHAFRVPNAGEVKGFATVITNSEVEPETIDTYELIYVKNTRYTRQEYTLFKSFWSDAITNVNFENKNTGENSAYGAEVSFSYLKNRWKVPFSASYVRSENEVDNRNYVAFPKWIINAGLGYQFSASQLDVAINNRFHFGAKEGQIADTLSTPEDLKEYWRTDLHISKQWNKKAALFADVRNVFNRNNFIPSVQVNPSTGGLPDESISVKFGLQYQL